ncbi:MAG: hypothetical protein HZA91_16625 [Verrucomicrobia bacterium]|nr:hypothetical protein [Verrucomicrobiota bacterium]
MFTTLPLSHAAGVELLRAPDGGIQPQAAVDARGVVHLIYFKGEPRAGDLFYVRREPGRDGFSKPVRVNSQAGSAVATGTIRGGQLALGRGGRAHVAWNVSQAAEPKGPGGGGPMLYARLNDAGNAFEAQRNLATWAGGLDGGGTVAADKDGRVFVAWHARGASEGETQRMVVLARSGDDGRVFERERAVAPKPAGACPCCSMRAFVDRAGALYLLYRNSAGGSDRDMALLVSRDHGGQFDGGTIHKWSVNRCPMSSESFTEGGAGVTAAWETQGQVYFAKVESGTAKVSKPTAAPGDGAKRKHPLVVASAAGETLFAWVEGSGWARGGSLAWQLYDRTGRPAVNGRADSVPTWSLLTGFARPDGGFVLVY